MAIVQSCYVPWKGYFDLVDRVDEFVPARRRPVHEARLAQPQPDQDRAGTEVADGPGPGQGPLPPADRRDPRQRARLGRAHWKTLHHAYAAAPAFAEHPDAVEAAYDAVADEPRLSVVNRTLLEAIGALLGVDTPLVFDRAPWRRREERSAPRDLPQHRRHGVRLGAVRAHLPGRRRLRRGWHRRGLDGTIHGYPEYPQLHPPFDHAVTVLDVLFNTGSEAPRYALRRPVEAAGRGCRPDPRRRRALLHRPLRRARGDRARRRLELARIAGGPLRPARPARARRRTVHAARLRLRLRGAPPVPARARPRGRLHRLRPLRDHARPRPRALRGGGEPPGSWGRTSRSSRWTSWSRAASSTSASRSTRRAGTPTSWPPSSGSPASRGAPWLSTA